jgi:hypothetical protein
MSNKNPWADGSERDENAPAPATKTFKGRVVLQPKPKQALSARGGRTERQAALALVAPSRVPTASPSPGGKQNQEIAALRKEIARLTERVQELEDRTPPTGLPEGSDVTENLES